MSEQKPFHIGSDLTTTDLDFFRPHEWSADLRSDAEAMGILQERQIYPDIDDRFKHLMEQKGWAPLSDYDPNFNYPRPTDWALWRIAGEREVKHHQTRSYPFFVYDGKGNLAFGKCQISPDPKVIRGINDEAQAMPLINTLNVGAPRLLDYSYPREDQADEDILAYILFDTVPFKRASSRPVDEWQQSHVVSITNVIHRLENADLQRLSNQLPLVVNFEEKCEPIEEIKHMLEHVKGNLPHKTLHEIKQTLRHAGVRISGISHKDMHNKNILLRDADISHNPLGAVTIIDWEYATQRIGFWGQDAGKVLQNLWPNPEAREIFVSQYVESDGVKRTTMLRYLRLGFIHCCLDRINNRQRLIDDDLVDIYKDAPQVLSQTRDILEEGLEYLK